MVKFAQNLWLWYKNGSHFSTKFGIKMGLLFKSQRHIHTQILISPPPGKELTQMSINSNSDYSSGPT